MTSFRTRIRSGLVTGANQLERRTFPETLVADEDWLRVAMNEATDTFLNGLDVATLSAAEISGSASANRGWAHFQTLDYPAFDICAPVTMTERFDVVICARVLEHVLDPFFAQRINR